MPEKLAPTGSGFPTVYLGDQTLHSRYNPRSEAEKYIASLSLRDDPLFFILIEPGLGYTIPALKKRFPGAAILALHVSDFFNSADLPKEADASWSPGSGMTLQQFLEDQIPDTDAARINIIEWRPSQAVYGAEYLRLFSETAEFVKRADANKKTVRNFGRRWFRNVIRNITLIRKVPRMAPWPGPLVITGAGPSLEESIPLIRECRQQGGLFVLAAASSVPALLARGVTPDLVLSTDGGAWALVHLYEALRSPPGMTFAAALWAALPSQMEALPWLPLSDGSLWQSLLLEAVGCPVLSLPQRGTVTAAALDLAFALSSGPVYITGTDLANRDLRTHARPYAFDRIAVEGASRLNPAYSVSFIRAAAQGTSGSMASRVYADWFRQKLDSYPGRLFSLGGNNPVFASRQVDGFLTGGGENKQETARFEIVDCSAARRSVPAKILIRGLEAAETAEALAGELGPLLFHDVTFTVTSLKEEIMRISGASSNG